MKTVVLLALIAVASLPLYSQTFGEITGEVRDPAGASVAGAAVTVTNRDTNASRSTATTDVGIYSFPALLPGVYNLRVEMRGFAAAVRNNLELQVQQTVRADFALQVGEVTQSIEVQGSAGLLNTEDSTIGTVIENRRIVDLPLNGRNYLQLVALTPNVSFGFASNGLAPGRQGGQRTQQNISAAGQRGTFNRFTLDGIENTDVNFLTYIFLPSIDAIQEFKVQTGIYPAEFGRAATQINVSSKPGTNQFHGALFEFLRNSALDAKNYAFTSLVPPKDPFRLNQYGFTLGGPVWIPKLFNGHNRLFFLSNYEGLRDRKQRQSIFDVPSLAMRNGDFSANSSPIYDPATRVTQNGVVTASPFPGNIIPRDRFNPASIKLLEFLPQPNLPSSNLRSNFQTGLNRVIDRDQFTTRIDLIESTKSTWFGRYSWSDEQEIQAGAAQNGSKVSSRVRQVVASNTRVFTPTLVNEFRFGYNNFFNNLGAQLSFQRDVLAELNIPGVTSPSAAAWGIPTFQLGRFGDWGNTASGPYSNDNQRYQWNDNIAWTHGAHSFRFGFEILNDHFNQFGNDFVRGAFAFDGTATQNPASRTGTGESFADFLLGTLRNSQKALALADVKFRALSQYYYVDDTWKIAPRLTVHLGLRYENTPPYKDVNNTAISVHMPYNDRESNVTDPNRHPTLVRVGSGDFYENTLVRFNPAIRVARDGRLGDRLVARDNNDFAPRIGMAWSPTGKWTVRTGFGAFYSQDQGNARFDIGRNLAGRRSESANIDTLNLNFRRPFSDPGGNLVISTPFAFANVYNRRTPYTLEYLLNVQREISPSTVLEVGYLGSVSRKLEQLFSLNSPPPSPSGSPQRRRPYQEFGVIQMLDSVGRGNYNGLAAKFQRRFSHGLTYLVGYTFSKTIDTGSGTRPPGNDSSNPNDNYNLNGDRALAAFHTAHRLVASPLYELPFWRANRWVGGWQLGSIVTLQSGNPMNIRVGSDRSNTGNFSDRPNATGLPTQLDSGVRNPEQWFNRAAYALQQLGALGNAGRNTVMGPGILSWDFSTQKNFRIIEGHDLQFRFEAFNFPNHPNWGDPGYLFTGSDFGVIRTTRTNMRELQFGLKYLF